MKNWLKLAVLATSLITSTCYASEKPVPQINETMVGIGQLMDDIFPFIVDETQFADIKNRRIIRSHINHLEALFESAEPHFSKKPITYKVSSNILVDHIKQAKTAYDDDNFELARRSLKSLSSACTACHMQDNQSSKLYSGLTRKQFKSDFDFAQFNFMTRGYNTASDFYQRYLKASNIEDSNRQQIALERLLLINTQIHKRPKQAEAILKEYQSLDNVNSGLKNTLGEWLEGLNEYMEQSGLNSHEINYEQLNKYMNKHYSDLDKMPVPLLSAEKDKIFYIMLRGSLYEYLNLPPLDDEIPVILYWLAVCDRTLEYNFYHSLADLYLKECIQSFPNHPFAKKCYSAYEDYLEFAYTGSAGNSLPEYLQDELNALKQLLK